MGDSVMKIVGPGASGGVRPRGPAPGHGYAQDGAGRFLGGNITRDAGAKLGEIDRPGKTQNAETGSEPFKMRVEIENLGVVDRHRLEQAVAEQKTAIGYRNMRFPSGMTIRPSCHTRIIGARCGRENCEASDGHGP